MRGHGLAAVLVTAGVALAAVASVAALSVEAERAQAALVAAPRPFVLFDPIGDAKGAPDITSFSVARDASDRLTFVVNVADHPALKRGEAISIWIDSDRNAATGAQEGFGFEALLMLGWPSGNAKPGFEVGVWDGSQWTSPDVAADAEYTSHGLRFAVAGGDLGIGRSFRIGVMSELRSGKGATGDLAPGSGLARVSLGAPASIARMGRVTIPFLSLLPEAGKVLRVAGITVRVEGAQTEIVPGLSIGSMVRPDRIRCAAKIGGVTLPPIGACTWRVPKTARGKSLALTIAIAYHGDEWTSVWPLDVE